MHQLASKNWFEQIKHYVERSHDRRLYVLEGTVTSRQLSPPSVKVLLQPHGIETGWIPISSCYGGNGFGFLAIPPDQQAVKVIFDMGDINSGTVIGCLYNDIDLPPTLNNVDDVVFQHESGSTLYFHQNGDVDITAIGNLTLKGKTSSQTL